MALNPFEIAALAREPAPNTDPRGAKLYFRRVFHTGTTREQIAAGTALPVGVSAFCLGSNGSVNRLPGIVSIMMPPYGPDGKTPTVASILFDASIPQEEAYPTGFVTFEDDVATAVEGGKQLLTRLVAEYLMNRTDATKAKIQIEVDRQIKNSPGRWFGLTSNPWRKPIEFVIDNNGVIPGVTEGD